MRHALPECHTITSTSACILLPPLWSHIARRPTTCVPTTRSCAFDPPRRPSHCAQSALEDWETDTKGRHRLDFDTFYSSVFELTSVYTSEVTLSEYVFFVNRLIEGVTVPLEAHFDTADRKGSIMRKALDTRFQADRRRRWRHPHPPISDANREELPAIVDKLRRALLGGVYCKVVPSTYDEGRRSGLQKEATTRLREWITDHGSSDDAKRPSSIGTPADLMMALLNSYEEANDRIQSLDDDDDGAAAEIGAWSELLTWISEEEGHEIADDGARARLIALQRQLDTDHDGRISADDMMGTLMLQGKVGHASGTKKDI